MLCDKLILFFNGWGGRERRGREERERGEGERKGGGGAGPGWSLTLISKGYPYNLSVQTNGVSKVTFE